ncbi:zinc finger protein ZAT5 [Ricinus communis]|uniref:Nucleic acid binding protein, putative n=1 Tax=Ricinus communis TaxID=3988 RepID=B9S0D6_RICCO|nr:zinc finger protein ZAT5 [Ricinus communis]EEF42869.1 nucleic acid binding protein, putative [Ricinus communis]|eukprot:XP_002519455.1 zinc finger protein ZAT5 [Ricinus communis]
MMEQPLQELIMASPSSSHNTELITQIIRGKRTKRPRPLSPLRLAVACSSESGSGECGKIERLDDSNNNNNNINLSSSPSSSIEFAGGEEEDMANCLILLARGTQPQTRKLSEPEAMATTRAATTKGMMCSGPSYVYQCKTCNRCFPSFQALGGHRASHKKPNNKGTGSNEEKKGREQEEEDQLLLNDTNTTLSLQIANRGSSNPTAAAANIKSNKVHECSICGAEFSSGQALGGHMRRHRAAFDTTSTRTITPPPPPKTVSLVTSSPEFQETKKPRRNSLQLDLNLPAPEDHDNRESKFHFASKEQVLVFSSSPLVDCHY